MRRLEIASEVLDCAKEFYLDGNSLEKTTKYIRDKYGIAFCRETLKRRLKDIGVSRSRTESQIFSKRTHLNREEVIRLYSEGKSLRKMAKELKSTKGTLHKILIENSIPVKTSEETLRLKMKHVKFDSVVDPLEKAYISGFVRGDMNTSIKSKYTIRLTSGSTVDAFIELVEDMFRKYGPVYTYPTENVWKARQRNVCVELDSGSFHFLIERCHDNAYIEEIQNDEFFSFISGFIDSDGSIIIRKTREYFQFLIRMFNEDIGLLKTIRGKLESYGFKTSLYINAKKGDKRVHKDVIVSYNKDYWILEISNKRDVLRLLGLLNVRHREKIARKDLILSISRLPLIRYEDIRGFLANPSLPP
jgi:intein-encoded DNA endonuclease-like protein